MPEAPPVVYEVRWQASRDFHIVSSLPVTKATLPSRLGMSSSVKLRDVHFSNQYLGYGFH